jgi:hypothetical protein
LTLRTLPDARDSQSVEFHFSVIAFLNEEYLSAAAGHLGRLGTEPTRTCGVARTSFFELAGNFPRGFVFGFTRGLKRHTEAEEAADERAQEEQCGFHGPNFKGHTPFRTNQFCGAVLSPGGRRDAPLFTNQGGASHSEAATRKISG